MTRAVIATELGSIEVDLLDQTAPATVANFVKLAKQGFYDDVIFHRVIPGFMIQGGDGQFGKKSSLSKDRVGTGGPGYTFKDEFHKDLKHDGPGVHSMANAGPNTNGSQFFVCIADCTRKLTKDYNLFGYVIDGIDVAQSTQVGDVMATVVIEERDA